MPNVYIFITIMAFAVIGIYSTVKEMYELIKGNKDDDDEPP